jgi:hypothetical protein
MSGKCSTDVEVRNADNIFVKIWIEDATVFEDSRLDNTII